MSLQYCNVISQRNYIDCVKWLAVFILLFSCNVLIAQNGTYQKKYKNGSYCYVSFQKDGNAVKAEIFAWWNTPSSQTGSYYGTGTLKAGTCVLKSSENEPDCKVTLAMEGTNLRMTYDGCATDHLTGDFNGLYTKITDAVAGDYVVNAEKAYFHSKPQTASNQKAYVLKGDRVTLNLDRIIPGNWVNVYFVGANGKETSGYIPLANLKKADK
ncbi:MAG: hypothetical protein EOO45_06315 [Flavobacterium sp.]|nr:MAG: hypothetical protein EOO45_06315 [Flavobacterium sp.]